MNAYHAVFVHNASSTDVQVELVKFRARNHSEAKSIARSMDDDDGGYADYIYIVPDYAWFHVQKGPIESIESRSLCNGIGSQPCEVKP